MTDENAEIQGDEATTTEADAPAVSRAEYEALVAKLQTAEAKADAAIGDNAKYRQRERDRKAEHEQMLSEQGQFKALADERATTISELQTQLEGMNSDVEDAKRWRSYLQAEEERIADAAAELTDGQRAVLESIPDISKRAAALAEFAQAAPNTPKAAPLPSAMPAPSNGARSYGDMSPDERAAARVAARAAVGTPRTSLGG